MTKTISLGQGKIAFQVLLMMLCKWLITTSHLNLYDTDRRFRRNLLQFDCVDYRVQRETKAYQDLSDIVVEVIPFCFRPADNFSESFEVLDGLPYKKLSFEELRLDSIYAQQLFSWSTSIEIIERYQAYLNAPNTLANEYFYNCTPPRFGLGCQYSFEFSNVLSFNEIVERDFGGRIAYSESSDMTVQVPCYVLLNCHRHGQPWCLDWREVCDGVVDCFDESTDEQSCFEMEKNECNDDEFRCHNGLCVSHEFWENGAGETDCLDQSDRVIDTFYSRSCFEDLTFLCEEHSCRVKINSFSCGDGQCVPKFQNCENGRHVLLRDSMTAQGNLTDDCWNAMMCLTRLRKQVNETLCETWLALNGTAEKVLKQCSFFFYFPTIPVHSNHVYLLYKHPYIKLNMNQFLLPDNICYNQQLCDSIIPDFTYENKACVNASKVLRFRVESTNLWPAILSSIGKYFRVCSFDHDRSYEHREYGNHTSLYNCRRSAKLMSKCRIMDRMPDCLEGDDESYTNSCQLNDRYRITCLDPTRCWSPIVKQVDACAANGFMGISSIHFQSFCNGFDEHFYDNGGRKYSDELECPHWSCNNMYTRCDGFWNCKDGRDEYNCTQTRCSAVTFACILPNNYSVSCLPSDLVNNGIVHCIGALDEQAICRRGFPSRDTLRPFRCSIGDRCLQISQICNGEKDCSAGDDEDVVLCRNQSLACDNQATCSQDGIKEILCAMKKIENLRIRYFSVHTSFNYPPLKDDTLGKLSSSPTEHHSTRNSNLTSIRANHWPWYCHRGLKTLIWPDKNNGSYTACICPPSYYGSRCQYQNQRVSVSLRLSSNERHATYAVISMLVDDTDPRQQIQAYDQFVYIAKQSCSMKLDHYLLFRSRPKDISRNYSVRIDVFEKSDLIYVGSWHFPITFLFLPVNRLSIALSLSNHRLERSPNCSGSCVHGQCVKYVNKDTYFCRCFSTWSGIACNIPQNCQACSSKSICIGSKDNQPICACPIDRFGRRCVLTSQCPMNTCRNNGQCMPADAHIPGSNHTCICTDRFFGLNCERRKAQLDVFLDGIIIPQYLVAYFFTLSNQSDPIESTVLRKLTLFQRTVTFHLAVPFELVFIQANDKHYLAVLQHSPKIYISTSINPSQECRPADQLLNSTVMKMIALRRVVHYHWLCYTDHSVSCFIDESYLCLCTNDHYANCIEFNQTRNFACPLNTYCVNGGQCLQDHPTCPSTKICLCRSCFFGNQCQFYAKGLGSTLDEILGYEFQRNKSIFEQPLRVIVAATVLILIFVIGMINAIFAIITFCHPRAREVGCGLYLLASSITSLLTMLVMLLKFCFLFYTHQDHKHLSRFEHGNCFGIEPVLKVFLCLNNWLNACVAVDRTTPLLLGIHFNKKSSRKAALVVMGLLLVTIVGLFLPQFLRLHVFHDTAEERSWCVVRYKPWLARYTSTLIFIHYFAPLSINLLSILLVVLISAYQRSRIQINRTIWMHLRSQIKKHDHVLISSVVIISLTAPHFVISLILDCQKSSDRFWFYQIGYFLSFLPVALIFVIFVLPSPLYRDEFNHFLAFSRRRFDVFKLNRRPL